MIHIGNESMLTRELRRLRGGVEDNDKDDEDDEH
jgi:hypothetical protein